MTAPETEGSGRHAPGEPRWELEETPCDSCGSAEADPVLTGRDRLHGLSGTFHVVRCRRCGLMRTRPRPTAACLAAAYPKDYSPHQAEALRVRRPGGLLRWALVNLRGYPLGGPSGRLARWLLAWPAGRVLRSRRNLGYLPFVDHGRLLDFGCGVGRYVAKMATAGWRAEGMDLSADALAIGRSAGLTLHHGTLPGAELPAESFDAITMWQALEHVPSPKATLQAAWRLLRPGGRLLVAVPRIDSLQAGWFKSAWFALDLPRHLTHFSKDTLERHLRQTGFEVAKTWPVRRPANIRRSFGYLADERGGWMWRRLSHSRVLAGLLSYVALLAGGRTAQMVCVARRAKRPGGD